MTTEIATAPHLGGILHLATLAFAMTLAYLGLDRIGENKRGTIELRLREIADKTSLYCMQYDQLLIRKEGTVQLREQVGPETRAALCMLYRILRHGSSKYKQKHNLYDGDKFNCCRNWHKLKVGFLWRWVENKRDRNLVWFGSLLAGVNLLYLVWAELHSSDVGHSLAYTSFVVSIIVIGMVISGIAYLESAEPRLDRACAQCRSKVEVWVRDRVNTDVEAAKNAAGIPILAAKGPTPDGGHPQ